MIRVTKKFIKEKLYYEDYKRGSYSFFIKINSKIGIKLFCEKEDRDIAYERQKLASKSNLAPRVFKKIDFNYPIEHCVSYVDDDDEFFSFGAAYITEVAKTLKHSNNYSERGQRKILAKINETMDKLEKIDIEFFDDHFGNFGYVNKNFVAIDFGPEGM